MDSGGAPPQDPAARPVRDGYWIAYALCAALYILPLFAVHYLPMVDIPQRVAQVWLWCHLDDPMLGGRYELHLFSPYVLSYVIARVFALAFDPQTSVTLVIAMAVLGMPLAIRAVLRAFGSDPWWSLLGFPLSYGVSFYWGFVPCMAALPLGIYMAACAFDCAQAPFARRRILLAAVGFAAFFTHGLIWAFSVGICGLLLLAYRSTVKAFLLNALAILAAAPLALGWFVETQRTSELVHEAIDWKLGPQRFKLLLTEWIAVDSAAWAFPFGLLLLGLIAAAFFLSDASRRSWKKWIPCCIACACYMLLPAQVFHTYVFFERFAVFVPAFAFAAVPPAISASRQRWIQLATLAAVLLLSAMLWARLSAFDREARHFTALYEHMKPGKRVHSFAYDCRSPALGGPYYFHFPVWYQTDVGGEAFYSFAFMFAEPVRSKTNFVTPIPDDKLWPPAAFDPAQVNSYDYFVIRSARDLAPIVFAKAGQAIRPLARVDDWWLYERVGTAPESAPEVQAH